MYRAPRLMSQESKVSKITANFIPDNVNNGGL